ncbi:hypothetical protein LXA47_19895 [Massilia sp. P8910]|uniref:hypothetical protein n=1 Tax=Massilia antarctica TaxID=2765360 RepID=UPI001E453EF4|nr:hypothetical protein [Massilia antarctica]MCE3605848.1 hypothetical protein [Massilia antarctica]
MHKTNVNTEVLDTQADIVANAPSISGAVHQQSQDIETQILDAKILIEAIFTAVDGMHGLSSKAMHSVNMINCFATCALRNMELATQANSAVLNMTAGGAA